MDMSTHEKSAPGMSAAERARKRMLPGSFASPMMMPVVVPIVVVPIIIRTAVVGVGSRTVVVGRRRAVVVTRSIVIGIACRDRARGQCAGGETECQARAPSTSPTVRLRWRDHRSGAQGRRGSHNCQSFSHAHLLLR